MLPWHISRSRLSACLSRKACRAVGIVSPWLWRAWWWAGVWLPLLILMVLFAAGLCIFVLGILWVEGTK